MTEQERQIQDNLFVRIHLLDGAFHVVLVDSGKVVGGSVISTGDMTKAQLAAMSGQPVSLFLSRSVETIKVV